jgi:hypothetical protein
MASLGDMRMKTGHVGYARWGVVWLRIWEGDHNRGEVYAICDKVLVPRRSRRMEAISGRCCHKIGWDGILVCIVIERCVNYCKYRNVCMHSRP